jgi:hypothetical protein
VVALAATAGRPADAAAAAAAPTSPIGAHSMLQLDSPPSFMAAMFAEAAGLHASALRLDVAPSMIFTSPTGPPDFSGLDEVMALSQQYQMPVVADLLTIPSWLAACQAPTAPAAAVRCGTDDLAGYGAMIGQIVAHADPVIRDWEVWNEPDNGGFFTGTPQQYAWMLRTAHDAIKAIDPQAAVLLGGISGISGLGWLMQVFTTPGADAAQAFDIANVHERAQLDGLAIDITAWKRFFAAYGFNGPLWVTEHGYPSDPAYQTDPAFAGGPASQASYLSASIPTLIDAGAAEVFVTERDNLSGPYASEGLLGGDVSDPPVADPVIVPKPAYGAVAALAECYIAFGRDCPGAPPAAAPSTVTFGPTAVAHISQAVVTVSDPDPEPLLPGPAVLTGSGSGPVRIAADGCASQILEPDQTCTITLRFAPRAGGVSSATLAVPSDDGTLQVGVSAVAPAVAVLRATPAAPGGFAPVGAPRGSFDEQRLALTLTDPLPAPVRIAAVALAGADRRRFALASDRCAPTELAPGASCTLTVVFAPAHAGRARAQLVVRGDGPPLSVALAATALPAPVVTTPSVPAGGFCLDGRGRALVTVMTDQPATVSWTAVRTPGQPGPRCGPAGSVASAVGRRRASETGDGRRASAAGLVTTARRRVQAAGARGYVARVALPLRAGTHGLEPGTYRLTLLPANAHGDGPTRTIVLTVL